jgi:dipeptidyl aminopeptidase/acylaminoacyl peptidase
VWLIDIESGKKDLLTPKTGSETVAYGKAMFSKDGKGVYLTSDADSEFQRLVYLDLTTRKTRALTASLNWDVDYFDLSKNGQLIAFATNEDGIDILHVVDTKTDKEITSPKLPSGVVSGIKWRDSHEFAFNHDTASHSADAFSFDITTGKLERWTFGETGGLNAAEFAQAQLIHWKSWDERSISGFLYKPPANIL